MTNNIHIININTEDRSNEPNYYFCGSSVKSNPLANPFTFNGKHTSLKKLSFKTREEAINAYGEYFDAVYGQNGYEPLTNAFNTIYKHYKAGEDIWLGSFDDANNSHCKIIAERLQKKLIREKMVEHKLG